MDFEKLINIINNIENVKVKINNSDILGAIYERGVNDYE